MRTITDDPTVTIETWEEIIPFDEISTPNISADFIPGWAGAFVRELSGCAQTPEAFAVMLAFSTIAACAQKRVCVSPFGDDYIEPLNIWTVGVMPPGSRKTFIEEQLTQPLVNWEHEQAEALKIKIHETEATRRITQKRIARLEEEAAKETDSIQRAAVSHEIALLRDSMPEEIHVPQLFTTDCTPEAFVALLEQQCERMAVLSDESGIFEVMAGLYTDGRVNMDVFLKSHAGSSVRVNRKNGGAVILRNPVSTFGLAAQPIIIEELNQGSKRRFRGNGCLARFLYDVPTSNIGHRDVTRRHVISDKVRLEYHTGIYSLLKIPAVMLSGIEQPRILRLDPEALLSWTAYQQALEPRQAEGGDLHAIADWTAKLPGAALRLAGLSHVIEHGPEHLVISRATMERSLDLADLLIQHALAAFSVMGADQTISDAQYVLRWIKAQGKERLTQNQILKGCDGRIKKIDRLQKALAVLIDRNMISDPITVQPPIGRSSLQFLINPAIHIRREYQQ